MYFIVSEVNGFIEEEKGNKYTVFEATDKSNKVLKKHTELWGVIKNEIKTINGGK